MTKFEQARLDSARQATLAGGCFWCTEAIFKRLRGVKEVISGYAGHAEAIQITFDPKVISYETLLAVFFKLHDPTTLNRQGADVGPQYRSAIFYHDEEQRKMAEKVKKEIEESEMYSDPIVTEIVPFGKFYKADESHQNFYDKNRLYQYCQVVIDPKIKKLYENFGKIVKK